jgi:hypothetical protein
MLPLDLAKRYDVYCNPHGQPTVVYRDVLLKRERSLFARGDHFDRVHHFVELELPDGRPVFVSRMSIIAFCEAGSDSGYESPKSSPTA